MFTRASHLAFRPLAIACGLSLLATPAAALRGEKAPIDSTWVVTRVSPARARQSLRTRSNQATVLLLDTTLVVQVTDRALAQMKASVRDSASEGIGARLIAQVVGSTLGAIFDHGIAYDLRGLREARAEGSRLILEDRAGKRVFDRMEFNGRDLMDDFSPAEASRFAAAVNRALRR